MESLIGWVEIPVKDIERAAKFYGTVLQKELEINTQDPERRIVMLHMEGSGASLLEMEGFEPSEHGPLAYLNAGESVQSFLTRVEEAGGTVVIPRTRMDDMGFYGTFLDSEGNTLGAFAPE